MKPTQEDLAALALDAIDAQEARCLRDALAADPALAAEYEEIERHLRLHDRIPSIQPAPSTWQAIATRLEETPEPRSMLRRFWPTAAAAALLVAAFLWSRGGVSVPAQVVHGEVARRADGTWSCAGISRMVIDDGIVVTMDAGTVVQLPEPRRLALRAGRAFFEVRPEARGFTVEAGAMQVVTRGTAFLVEHLGGGEVSVWTESGRVECRWPGGSREVAAGERCATGMAAPGSAAGRGPRDWFRRPTMTATLADETTLRVVIRNEMPDAIQLAPPTGGEPLFYASFGGHDFGLTPLRGPLRDAPVRLAPGLAIEFELGLPQPVPGSASLTLSYPGHGLRVEVVR